MNVNYSRPMTLVMVAVLLVLLLAATVGLAFAEIGPLGPVAGLGIAALKALLIAVVFMNLVKSSPTARLFAAAGLFWLAILFALTLADTLTRT